MALTQKEKELLLKDLCARLPYGVFVVNTAGGRNIRGYLSQVDTMYKCVLIDTDLVSHNGEKREFSPIEHIKPYLRPMSSMTEDEYKEYDKATDLDVADSSETLKANLNAKTRVRVSKWYHGNDWLNAHHFDYRGLIEKGLALEATENMYQI